MSDDPDGNGRLLQDVTERLPGRVEAGTTFSSGADPAAALRRAAAAHGAHETRTGAHDEDWPDRYARSIAGGQAGRPLPHEAPHAGVSSSATDRRRPTTRTLPEAGRRVTGMSNRILVFYGSYRSDRTGIRLAEFLVERLRRRGDEVELIDAKAINLPMLDRMYKEYPKGEAPDGLEQLAQKIRGADGFVFVTGEYNWGVQPGLKNLTDHFLEEWFWRPAAIASYSAGRLSGARAATAWHGTLSEMGMIVISSTIAVGPIGSTLSPEGEPTGEGGRALDAAFPRFADDLTWWVEAAKMQRQRKQPPY